MRWRCDQPSYSRGAACRRPGAARARRPHLRSERAICSLAEANIVLNVWSPLKADAPSPPGSGSGFGLGFGLGLGFGFG